MGRTVDICGVEMPTQSLGQPMDDAFDRLYKEFSEKGFLPVDDEFKTTASRYFDGFIGSVHAPAAHDHYFYCFLPIWNVLVSNGRPGMAERLWELAFEPVRQWEYAHPSQPIDKGALCYFWGWSALLNGNLDRGYLLIHQSFQEDSRTSGQQTPRTPSYALISLDYQQDRQAMQEWVLTQASFLESFVDDYATTHHRPLTIDDVKRRFFDKPPNYDVIFLLTFTVARLHGISGLPLQAKHNAFAGQIELNLLFDLLLVIDVAIRHANPARNAKYFSEQVSFLLQQAGHALHQRDFQDVHAQFDADLGTAIRDALDGRLKTNWVILDRLQSDLHLAYELRNRGAHQIETVPIIWEDFDRVQRAVFRCVCATIDFLY